MLNLKRGETYRQQVIDTSAEMVPSVSILRAFEGETHVFEPEAGEVVMPMILKAVENGTITEFDKTVLCIVATFGSACMTTRALKEMLLMMGLSFSSGVYESCIKRLHRFRLVNFSRFVSAEGQISTLRLITLTCHGSKIAKHLGVKHRFNPTAAASIEAYAAKSRAQIAQLVSNYLKNQMIDAFEVRPVIVVNADEGRIIRPAATMEMCGEEIMFEVPRRREGWLEDLQEKLERYELVFDTAEKPSVIINAEDEEMSLEVDAMIRRHGYDLEILYTDDIAMFGEQFQRSVYGFDEDGEKLTYEFIKEAEID